VDWKTAATVLVPIVSVLASSWVVIKSKAIEAVSRHADRQQERELAYEQRAWELKNAALATLIGACYHVLQQAKLPGNADMSIQRGRVVRAMEAFRDRICGSGGVIGQLLAYAADPVRQAVDHLLDTIEAELNLHVFDLWAVSRLRFERDDLAPELQPGPQPDGPAVTTVDVFERMKKLSTDIAQKTRDIGDRSTIDIENVVALCDQLIGAARNDLRAKHVEEVAVQRPWCRRTPR
jgi:hypothetical protein